jgi:hypothetical protein
VERGAAVGVRRLQAVRAQLGRQLGEQRRQHAVVAEVRRQVQGGRAVHRVAGVYRRRPLLLPANLKVTGLVQNLGQL